jgi:hypothetical protein
MEGDTHIFWRAGRLALLASAALTLGACVAIDGLEPGAGAAVDPASSAGTAVAAAVADPGPWPTFAGIPQLPADLRSPEAWRDAVAEQEADGLFTRGVRRRPAGEGRLRRRPCAHRCGDGRIRGLRPRPARTSYPASAAEVMPARRGHDFP